MLSPTRSLCALIALAAWAAPASAETGRTTPGLVIETGTRNAYCDQLHFSPDGAHLLAVGEDKVIRRWAINAAGFLHPLSVNARWPIMRESRGSLFAASYSHTGDRLAIGGFGIKTGLVATLALDDKGGRVEYVIDPVPSGGQVWAIAFSPDDRVVVYGNEYGEVFAWEPGVKKALRPFKGTKFKTARDGKPVVNRVRLVGFTGRRTFLSVAMDGQVREWDADDPDREAKVLHTFNGGPNVFRAVISPDKRLLAAASSTKVVGESGKVELFDLANGRARETIAVPSPDNTHAVRALAFSRDGDRLAVGCNETPKLETEDFYRLVGGQVFVFELGDPAPKQRIEVGYSVEAVAFHPKLANLLATAGGENHEVALWNPKTGAKVGGEAVVRGPANCVWAVGLDKGGKYFGWKERRVRSPKHPNELGAGEWRVFDLKGRDSRQILPSAPKDFDPVPPVSATKEWQVKPTDSSAVWRVVGPGVDVKLDDESGLYDLAYNQEPRCWTFVPEKKDKTGKVVKPVRLAVGHQWGVSLYECRPKDGDKPGSVKLARIMTGHEGQVMAVAPSADGELLITGSRDQTVCLWSLGEWTTGNEMGASFANKGGKLVVTAVDPGSPAWEPLNPRNGTDREINRLAKGDVIDLLMINKEKFVYDPVGDYKKEFDAGNVSWITDEPTPSAAVAALRLKDTRPAVEYLLAKRVKVKDKVGGKEVEREELVYKITTCRQRPLLRFFATRSDNPLGGREWVIWRPRDYFYDTSASGDRYVGWHVNGANPADTPEFYPLERFRGSDHVEGPGKGVPSGFHRPDKIWPFVLRSFQEPEKVIFTEIEPPRVSVRLVEVPKGGRARGVKFGTEVRLEVSITPADPKAPAQLLKKMTVWLNDHQLGDRADEKDLALAPDADGRFAPTTVRIAADKLRWGTNVITVQCFNARGGRGEATALLGFGPAEKPKGDLHAILVGINDYSHAKGYKGAGVNDLQCSVNDAIEMEEVLKQHAASTNFNRTYPTRIKEDQATASNILEEIRAVGKRVKPDDWLMVYLSGHGEALKGEHAQVKPGTYFYVCRDTDVDKVDTMLTSKKLYDALVSVRCNKVVILDTCHSGAASANTIPSDQLRDLMRDGKRFLILSSCQATEQALEPAEPDFTGKTKWRHGFFTHALLDLIVNSQEGKNQPRQVGVTYDTLAKDLSTRLNELLKEIDTPQKKMYAPVMSPPDPTTMSVFAKPLKLKGPKKGGEKEGKEKKEGE